MTPGLLTRLRLPRPKPQAASRPSRRKSARAALGSGLVAFLAATAGLAAAMETVKPEWRDPEFSHRINQLHKWQATAPDRPLVLAFGSSRTQMGIAPAAMGFPDQPGSPIVYNFGYRAAHPLAVWYQFTRVLDSGIKPRAVFIQLAPIEVVIPGLAENQFPEWGPRMSLADIRLLEPITQRPNLFRWWWFASRLKGWSTYREPIRSDLVPKLQPQWQRFDYAWETMDEFGFAPHSARTVSGETRALALADVRGKHLVTLRKFQPTTISNRVFSMLVERCREEGIAIAFFWAPESPTYRSWYSARTREQLKNYSRWLEDELHAPVFPAPQHLDETDFADGFHLLRSGAQKYSRWLADEHLRPWLLRQGVPR
jgi:hypothetical protein